MTKLVEWLTGLALYFSVWYAILTGRLFADWSKQNGTLVLWFPILTLAVFGFYCVLTIAYRVATFNDCPEAAEQLKQEIDLAKEDLRKKGLKMD